MYPNHCQIPRVQRRLTKKVYFNACLEEVREGEPNRKGRLLQKPIRTQNTISSIGLLLARLLPLHPHRQVSYESRMQAP